MRTLAAKSQYPAAQSFDCKNGPASQSTGTTNSLVCLRRLNAGLA
jgi:hypothetical protein